MTLWTTMCLGRTIELKNFCSYGIFVCCLISLFFSIWPLVCHVRVVKRDGAKTFWIIFLFLSTLFFFPDQTKWTSKLAIFRGKPILNSILETSYAWTEDKGATLTRTLANTQCSQPKTSPLKMSKSNDAHSRVKTFFLQSRYIRVSTIQ